MKNKKIISVFILLLAITFFPAQSNAGEPVNLFNASGTDGGTASDTLFYFFDLRDRESFIQLTFFVIDNSFSANMHVQIFDVSNNCNENDFFDVYTNNDTHVYNMRDIQTNDGNPSGVVLPDGAYGIIAITFSPTGPVLAAPSFIGNIRILDDNGYEYRTNAQYFSRDAGLSDETGQNFYSFNFNQQAGVTLSDVVGLTVFNSDTEFGIEYLADPLRAFNSFDVDIYDLNEVPFSCRDIIFSCVNQESALLESLLEFAGTANVADFEYGINNVIPHSKGGELLCPGNTVGEGIVILRPETQPNTGTFRIFLGFVGLNNGDGRGSLDSFWQFFIEPV